MILDLQKRQHKHDQEHHQDIFNISYPERMNHYVLHFSKYTGRLSREGLGRKETRDTLRKTIADSVIVALASANTLNMDIGKRLRKDYNINSEELSVVAEELNEANLSDEHEISDWLFSRLATPAGNMANAMESLDHMESVNTRQVLEDETVEIMRVLLIAAYNLDVDLAKILDDRWNEIEEESIL